MKNEPAFLGVFMNDTISKVNFNKRFSMILNLQNSNQGGSHWVCIYNSPNSDSIEYFDSYGLPPTNEVEKFLKSSHKKVVFNNQDYQVLGSTSCGYFCIFYIKQRNDGVEPYDILHQFVQNPSDENENIVVNGAGFFDFVKNAASQVFNTVKAVFTKQSRLQPQERKIMEENGNKKIVKIIIHREPIKTVPVDRIMNLLTGGNFSKSLNEFGYDKLFHLYIIISLNDGTEISIEKNETIQMKKYPTKSGYETLNVNLNNKSITLNEMMQKASDYMGDSFFTYSATNNNCQKFVSSIITAIGLNTSEINTFVNQPVEELFRKYDSKGILTSSMKTIINFAAKLNLIRRGGKYQSIIIV